jgi:Bacterial Ig domain
MATLLATGLRRPAIVALGLVLLMLGHGRAYAASPIKIASPLANSTVAKLVTASVKIKSEVKKVGFMVDGVLMASSPSTTFSWDSTAVPNGPHTISALAYSASNQLLRTVSEAVRVTNKASATAVSFVSPTNGQTVSGSINVALSFSSPPSSSNPSSVWSTRLSVDGVPVAWGYNNLPWNTTSVADGSHSLRIDGYPYNSSTVIGTQTIGVTVKNAASPPPTPTLTPRPTVNPTPTAVPTPKPTPTAVPTVHPTATPTPTTTGCVTITSPTANSAVSGAVTIGTKDTCTGNWYEALAVDGAPAGAGVTGQVVFTSSSYPNGTHTILITSQSMNPGSVVLGSASESVNVENSVSTGTSTPTPVGTPAPPVGGHYSMLGPGASLPNVADCVNAVNASAIPENAPWNQNDGTGYNYNKPPPGGVPSYFYTYAPAGNELPHADFAKVDGNYSGSTDDLIRITACKWGIDEDYVRAQAWIEDGWHQDCAAAHGGIGCRVAGDMNSPAGDPSGLPVTPITPNGVFSAIDGYGNPGSATDHWDSWSMLQTKVWYDWMTWPMIQDSTSFGLDFRFAEMRGCVNGDETSYYNSQSSSMGSDYQNAVSRAQSNPNGASPVSGWTNLQYLSYGCIDTHFSGAWFNGSSDSYLVEFLDRLSSAPWPGGLR